MMRWFFACLFLAGLALQLEGSLAQNTTPGIQQKHLSGADLHEVLSDPYFQAYDLSPDGSTIALLAVDGPRVGAPLWLAEVDIATGAVVRSSNLGVSTFPAGGFVPQVSFSSDGQLLVVQDLQTIRVLDAKNQKVLDTLKPPAGSQLSPIFVIGAKSSAIFACAFATPHHFHDGIQLTPSVVVVYDLHAKTALSSWPAKDVPQAISPNGELIAVSSIQVKKGMYPLDIVNRSGTLMTTLSGGFAFPRASDDLPIGRVLGSFIDNQEILLTSDEHTDKKGHHSGEVVKLSKVDGSVDQTIKLRNYASAGEIATAANGDIAVTISWFVPPAALIGAEPMPRTKPELFTFYFDKQGRFVHQSSMSIEPFGFAASGWIENRRPRISSNGSVIALAQRRGISIFRKVVK